MTSNSLIQKKIRTSVLEIAYEESGPPLMNNSNPPIILLHGWPYSVRQYDAVVARLIARSEDKSQDYTILVPHLRGFGGTRYLNVSEAQSGQQAAITQDLLDFLDVLEIPRALLVGYDWGARAACCMAALYPSRVVGLVTCHGYHIQNIAAAVSKPPTPHVAETLWYQFYLNTPIGEHCLNNIKSRKDLAKHLWKLWSPNWQFTESEYDEASTAFENEDFAKTTIHSYRHRWAAAPGIASLQTIEAALANEPTISVPTISVRGGSDGVHPPTTEDTDRRHFTGFYERQVLSSVGHCPPAEDPEAVVLAIGKLLDLK